MSEKRQAGARPGGRNEHWKIRRSEAEAKAVDDYAKSKGKTVSLIVREALVSIGALPPDTPLVDGRTTKKILKSLN